MGPYSIIFVLWFLHVSVSAVVAFFLSDFGRLMLLKTSSIVSCCESFFGGICKKNSETFINFF